MTGSETVIFTLVVGARLLVPLLIFRYPLPAILACLVIDGVDQTIFQTYTDLPLDNYQSYDKALDIYYQSLAYISTLRNWTNVDAVGIGRFLLFYRMVGVLIFELVGRQPLPAAGVSQHVRVLLHLLRGRALPLGPGHPQPAVLAVVSSR